MTNKTDKIDQPVAASAKADDSRVADASVLRRQFADFATYSATDRTAISVRDGVIEYLGAELGLEPADRIFTVYRSPATIANAAMNMAGIPLTDEHVSLDDPAPETGSRVSDARMVDMLDEMTQTRVAIRNRLALSDSVADAIRDKRQLSLGYHADLVPHERFDFEQVDIVPHHLAAVPAGRCGPLCSFLDRNPQTGVPVDMKMHKAFTDQDGAVSLEQIVEIATALPEAIRKVPVDKLTELMPAMQEVMSYAKEQGAMPEEDGEPVDDMADEDGGDHPPAEEDADMADEEKPKFSDADFKDAVARAVESEVKRFGSVVSKARNFLDEDYDFTGKAASEVMRDALATQSTDKFEDAELPVAFKLLRKPDTDYSKFGDSKPEGSLTTRIKQSLEG